MKLIEITGIPGSGKSTIAPIVKEFFKKEGFDVYDGVSIIQHCRSFPLNLLFVGKIFGWITSKLSESRIRSIARILELNKQYSQRFIRQNSDLFAQVKKITESRPISKEHKNLTISFFLNTASSYQIALESLKNNSILILEEGFVHKATTLFVSLEENNIDFKEIEKYLNRTAKVNAVINVQANEILCQKRLSKRKLPIRLENKKDDEIMKFLSKSKSVIDFNAKYLINKGIPIFSMVNESETFSKDSLIKNISKELLKL